MNGTVHIAGAGLAGLSAAARLAEAGRRVVVHEAARMAGGRCRSYHDPALDLVIDNGNHLLLSGNRSTLDFLARIGGGEGLNGPPAAVFDFADAASGERWRLRPNAGRLPWWVLDARRRVPRTRPRDYLAPVALLRAKPNQRVGDVMACAGPLYDRLWRPVLLAGLNTEPREGSAGLAAALLRETLAAGGKACRPLVATTGLGAAFVDPALAWLAGRGVPVRYGARLRHIGFADDEVRELDFGEDAVRLGPGDTVILAVPPWSAQELVPGLIAPQSFSGILNAHFRVAPPAGWPLVFGIVNGVSEWLFAFAERLSVTVSAADRLFDTPREELAATIWREVAALTGLAQPLPPWQIVKERRATFAATPAEEARRPAPRTRFRNLVLAGDWTATGVPATIEGAVRSGYTAAALAATLSARPTRMRSGLEYR